MQGAMRMHVITNLEAWNGAESMLARLLRLSRDEPPVVVSLREVSDRNRAVADNPDIVYHALHADAAVRLPGAMTELRRLIRRYRPDQVVCWMYHAMVVGILAAELARPRTPVIWNVRQSLDDPASLGRSTRLANAAAARLSARSAGTIFNSERALVQHRAYGYRCDPVAVIPNGFVLPVAEPPAGRVPTIFGLASRDHPQKDLPTFFRAAAELVREVPAVRLIAAGSGMVAENAALVGMIDAAGLPRDRIELRGRLMDMAEFYREIDVLVLSSRTEGFPNVIAEAMSYSRIVVSTDAGDAARIIGRTGRVVPRQDPVALAAAMVEVARMPPETYAAMAAAARVRIAENYDITQIAQQYERFFAACAHAA